MRTILSRLTLLSVVAALLLVAQPASSQNDITITDLGELKGGGKTVDINSQGQVVGWYQDLTKWNLAHFLWTPGNTRIVLDGRGLSEIYINDRGQVVTNHLQDWFYQAILWEDGEETALGHLGGGYSSPRDINELGHVVGASGTASEMHAFLWTPGGGMQDLGTLGGGTSKAFAANDLDWVVGEAYIAQEEAHAFLWTPNQGMTDLGTLGGASSVALDVNNLGQVVGWSETSLDSALNETHAFLWTPGAGMIDLGTLGGTYSKAVDVNEEGQVVGDIVRSDGLTRGFLWTANGGMQDLGTLGAQSYAKRINNWGQVVGVSYITASECHAFLWTPAQGMIDLGTLAGHQRSDAADINEQGQIAGYSILATGEVHAVLWTVPVPEPRTPEEQIAVLIGEVGELVDGGVLKEGNGNALIQKLENAVRMLEEDKDPATCGQLQAFVNQVEALTDTGRLPEEIAAGLIDAASSVIDQVCG
jgi:probable HAF family extracellular repeat protein